MGTKRIIGLNATTDFESDDNIVVDSTTAGTRKMAQSVLKEKLREDCLGNIHNLPTSITAFRTGDVIPVDGPSGTAKMSKDDLLKATAENALDRGSAREFDEAVDYLAGQFVSRNGSLFIVLQDVSAGAWDGTKFKSIPCGTALYNLFTSIDKQFQRNKAYSYGEHFVFNGEIWRVKRATTTITDPDYIRNVADRLTIYDIVNLMPEFSVIHDFPTTATFIADNGTTSTNSSFDVTDYINIAGATSLFVGTTFANQYGGGVIFYDGNKKFVGSIHDDGEGGYSGVGSYMERTIASSDFPANSQYIRVVRANTTTYTAFVQVNGVDTSIFGKKANVKNVSPDYSNVKNYARGNIVFSAGKNLECNDHQFGGAIDLTKFSEKPLSEILEKIAGLGNVVCTDFWFYDKFVNSNGYLSTNTAFCTTEHFDLTGVDGIIAKGCFGNQYGGGLSFYDKNYVFISQIHDDGSGNYPDLNAHIVRTFTKSDFPANAKYVRLTSRSAPTDKFICLFGADLVGGIVGKCETKSTMRSSKWLANSSASMSTSGKVEIWGSPDTKNNYIISSTAYFSTFGRIAVYHGTSPYILGRIEIDDTNLYEYSRTDGSLKATTPHGLTMSDFVNVTITVGQLFNLQAKVVICSGTKKFTKNVEWCGSHGNITLESISGNYTNCEIKLSGIGYRMDTWLFGDSYCDMWPDRLLDLKSDARFMIDSYSGRGSIDAYWSLMNDFKFGFKPKRIIWAMGMNNADNGVVNADWKTIFDLVKALCEKMGIDFIPCTIPCTPTRDNSYKNAYIAANCTEYIDVAGCVGATTAGSSWFSGLLGSDNVHPTNAGQFVIANTMLGYLGV